MQKVRGAADLAGRLAVPPDKSISHRAAIFGAIASGQSVFTNFLSGADCLDTVACLRALGVDIELSRDHILTVTGAGYAGLTEPEDILDCGNSGTTMRLLSGLLAGRPFLSVLGGDASLRSRPMRRVAEPLNAMGATVLTTRRGSAPLVVHGAELRPIEWRSQVASAQVKSAILLAGLQTKGVTTIHEPGVSRDHSERMLRAMGAEVSSQAEPECVTSIQGTSVLRPLQMRIPGDFSSAAPWLVAAACHPESDLLLTGVGLNPTRTGLLQALLAMGADIEVLEERKQGGEPVGDLRVKSATLHGIEIGSELVARSIDELPLLALAATQASGRTVVREATELKVKESDRVATTARILAAMGAHIDARDDGWAIEGPTRLQSAELDSLGDHRMAFLAAAAGLLAEGETHINRGECASVSYPSFWGDLETTTGARERVPSG